MTGHADGVTLRPLERADFSRGHPELLAQLTEVGAIAEEAWNERFDALAAREDYLVLVAVDDATGRVVGTATLLVELKFLRALGRVGHIEDVVVDVRQRGQRLGQKLIGKLSEEAARRGCYKAILDCSEENVGFYKRCGLERKGACMGVYFAK